MVTCVCPSSISTHREPRGANAGVREGGKTASGVPLPGGRLGVRSCLPWNLILSRGKAWGKQGWQPHPSTHQHMYTLHGRGVHPPGFKCPVCPKMALQSCLLGEGRQGQNGCNNPLCSSLSSSQGPCPTLILPLAPELCPSQTGDQYLTLKVRTRSCAWPTAHTDQEMCLAGLL